MPARPPERHELTEDSETSVSCSCGWRSKHTDRERAVKDFAGHVHDQGSDESPPDLGTGQVGGGPG